MTSAAQFLRHFLSEGFLAGAAAMTVIILILQTRLDRERLGTVLMVTLGGVLFFLAALYGHCGSGACD